MAQRPRPRLAIPRRGFVGGLLAAGGMLAAGPALARAVSAAEERRIAFDIRREGATIGRHAVDFRREGEALAVEIEIDISISFAFIPVFAYRHRNRELWQGERLQALDSETDDDGRRYRVAARQTSAGLQVTGSGGEFLAPAEILPTSYWNPRTVAQTRLLDTQHGRLLDVAPRLLGEELLDGGEAARRYRLSGDLDLDLWYSPDGEWLKTAFETRGAAVSYARRRPDDAAGDAGGSSG
ncbi:MAG: DUF6134 family protein [Kiloniellaceae bacterium]